MSRNMRIRIAVCLSALLVTTSLATTASASIGAAQAKPTGKPIKLMQWAGDPALGVGQELYEAANASVQAVNDAGGIPDPAGGPNHPLQLLKCVIILNNPLVNSKCARQAIDNKVVAVTGKYYGNDDAVRAVQNAGIPVVDALALAGTLDTSSRLSFPLSGGSTGLAIALGAALQQAGAQKITLALADSQPARAFPALTARLLKNKGSDMNPTVYYPIDTSADVTPYAAQIANRLPDGVAIVHTTDGTVRMIKALREAGYAGKIAVAASFFGPSDIKTLGSKANDLIVVSNFVAATSKLDKGMPAFNKVMDKYAPKSDKTELAVGSWASLNIIADALRIAKTQDPAGLAAALQGFKVINRGAPTFILGVPGLKIVPAGRTPRDTVQIQTVRGGKIVPLKDGQFLALDSYTP